MELILISPQSSTENEVEKVIALFIAGLEVFHLRKPGYSKEKMMRYIEQIPEHFHNRIVIHSHHRLALKYSLHGIHLSSSKRKSRFDMWAIKRFIIRKNHNLTVSTSFHKISNIDHYDPLYNYVFLSPVFDSISKKDYQSGFDVFSLKKALQRAKYRVYALGGLCAENIVLAKEYGFKGGALLGGIWTEEDPVESFKKCLSVCKKIEQ